MAYDKTYLNPDDIVYRKGVGLMIINAQRQVLVGQRVDNGNLIGADGAWQMPQGGIDNTETPWEAALREMKEEIGTTHVRMLAESQEWFTYDFPEPLRSTLWGGRFFGQTQKWFLLEFLGQDSEINIQTRHPEFVAWRWADVKDLPDMIVTFKRELYKQLLEEFKEFF